MARTPPIPRLLGAVLAASLLFGIHPAAAQIPGKLLHTILAPPVGRQTEGGFGYRVAIDGALAIASSPFDDIGALDAGLVKVFDSSTGALLEILRNPAPGEGDQFGHSLAVSGTRVAVGAPYDYTASIRGGGAHLFDLGGANPTEPLMSFINPAPKSGYYFGRSITISGTLVIVGALGDTAGAHDTGRVYVYDSEGGNPTTPVSVLTSPNSRAYDQFGFAMASDGDLVVVGSPFDNVGSTEPGGAYLFNLADGASPVLLAKFNNPDPMPGANFGYSVAISGTRIIIGAPYDDTSAVNAGSAYVFDLAAAAPEIPVATLHNPSPAEEDRFGYAVAIDGTRVVIGAYRDDTAEPEAGIAYVYEIGGPTPDQPVAILSNPTPATYDYFGRSVAVSGSRALVGAYRDDTGANNAGSAYLYELADGIPPEHLATLNDPGAAAGDYFGWSVAISGNHLVVGAPDADTGAVDGGTASVYNLAGPDPTLPVISLDNPLPAPGSSFGGSVAICGAWVGVGASYDSSDGNLAGIAYIYRLDSDQPTLPAYTLHNPNPVGGGWFGSSIAIDGTLVAIGALGTGAGSLGSGSAYFYDLAGPTPDTPVAVIPNPSPDSGDRFGFAVALSGTRLVVGCPFDDTEEPDSGRAYVFDLAGANATTPVAILTKPAAARHDYFGFSVAISGTRVVVGAYLDDTGATDAGSAYLYDLKVPSPAVPAATFHNPIPTVSARFGYAVAIDGQRVVVGAKDDDTGAPNAGVARIYDLTSPTPAVPVTTIANPAPAENDGFGRAVAINGSRVAVGTPFDAAPQSRKGSAHIFSISPTELDADGLPDDWELAYWETTDGHGPLDDDDRDGYCELLELALGLDPTVSDPGGLPAVFEENGYLTVTLAKRAGVAYEVQTAGTLEAGQPDSFSAASTTVLVDDPGILTVRDNVSVGTPPGRYLRVKVTAAP